MTFTAPPRTAACAGPVGSDGSRPRSSRASGWAARLPLLDGEEGLHVAEALRVDLPLERAPRAAHRAHGVDARVIVVDQLLPQRPSGVHAVVPAHVVEPEEE